MYTIRLAACLSRKRVLAPQYYCGLCRLDIYCIPLLTAILNEDFEFLFSLVQNSYLGLQYSLDCLFAKFIIETRSSICC